jgi:DNA invertase Pin-like site-specific DNA recombinase
MLRQKVQAVAYFRTSSATNVNGDSLERQQVAVAQFTKAGGYEIVQTFYDAAVSGADPIDSRPGFVALLDYIREHGINVVLVENASRFARDLIVQLTGHELLKAEGIELIAADAPDHFVDETPTANMVRQILGAVSEFEKASLVAKLKAARDRKSVELGRRCEGRPPVPMTTIREAKRLARQNPRTHKSRSLREIARQLASLGHLGPSGDVYGHESIKRMIRV